jgi:hypothetical protein
MIHHLGKQGAKVVSAKAGTSSLGRMSGYWRLLSTQKIQPSDTDYRYLFPQGSDLARVNTMISMFYERLIFWKAGISISRTIRWVRTSMTVLKIETFSTGHRDMFPVEGKISQGWWWRYDRCDGTTVPPWRRRQ